VVHAAGGYTAWIDKHASYSFAAGPGGTGLNDFYSPEVDSTVVPLPRRGDRGCASCATIRDPTADLSSWTNSFLNIQCYDALKVKALLNEIAGNFRHELPGSVHRGESELADRGARAVARTPRPYPARSC